MVETALTHVRRPSPLRFVLDRTEFLGPLFIAPAILYIALLIAVPFFLAVYYSVSAYNIASLDFSFVGLRNYIDIVNNDVFRKTLTNTFIFTLGSNVLALLLGQATALLLLKPFWGRSVVRSLIILPWAVPVALAAITWRWMFDSLYSVINWVLHAVHFLDPATMPNWLGEQDLAMISITVVYAWRLFPFAAVIFLAGLTSVPKAVLDAAHVDGAGFWRRHFIIILPMIMPITLVAALFGLVFTFTDLSVVYLLTRGGPMNGTHVLGSLAFQIGILAGDVAHGAAIALFLLPVLLIGSILLLRFLRRTEV